MLTCKYLNFKKSQAEILNYEIINMCRVLYINLNLKIPFSDTHPILDVM